MQNKKVLIATGGTGGHVIPSEMLAKDLSEQFSCEVSLCGKGIRRFLGEKKYVIHEISSAPLFQKNPLKLLQSLLVLGVGVLQAVTVLRQQKPDVVVGFGSYHSFPVLMAAYLLRKPIVLFEPNTVLGKVNRFFAKKSAKLAIQFPIDRDYHNAAFVPRLPWGKKQSVKAFQTGLDPKVFTFLVFGGSQGAAFLNAFFLRVVRNLSQFLPKFQVIHLTGSEDSTLEAQKLYDQLDIPHFVKDFETNIQELYKIADLAICRAGANTIAELIQWQVPSLLVPYPYAADGHQRKNAEFLATCVQGACFCEQKNLTEELFHLLIKEGIEENRFETYRKNLQKYCLSESQKTKKKLSEVVFEI